MSASNPTARHKVRQNTTDQVCCKNSGVQKAVEVAGTRTAEEEEGHKQGQKALYKW
jgi:hypothetical protein